MKVNSKKWLLCLSTLFATGLAAVANAQERQPIHLSHPAKTIMREQAQKAAKYGLNLQVKKPTDIVQPGVPVYHVQAHRVGGPDGGFRHFVGDPLYNNLDSVDSTPYFFYTTNNDNPDPTKDGTNIKQYWMDDYNLSVNVAHGAVLPTLNDIVFPIYNNGPDAHTGNVIIALYRDIVFGSTANKTAFDNVVDSSKNPLAVFMVSTSDMIASKKYGLYEITFTPAITLDKDLQHRLDKVPNYRFRYAFVIGYCSDNTFSAFSDTDTVLFNGGGVNVGHSEFWYDTNGTLDPTYEAQNLYVWPDGDPPVNPDGSLNDYFNTSDYVYYFEDNVTHATIQSNFWIELSGTLGSNPNTFEFSGTVTLDGLPTTAANQTLDVYLQSLTGKPTIHLTAAGLIPDSDPNVTSADTTILSYSAVGIPADMYHVTVKTKNYLATTTHVGPYFKSGATDPVGYLASDPYVLDLTTSNALVPVQSLLIYGGDADNNNVVDVGDFGILVNTYGDSYDPTSAAADPNDIAADFNGDGVIDISDFGILVNNYGVAGDSIL